MGPHLRSRFCLLQSIALIWLIDAWLASGATSQQQQQQQQPLAAASQVISPLAQAAASIAKPLVQSLAASLPQPAVGASPGQPNGAPSQLAVPSPLRPGASAASSPQINSNSNEQSLPAAATSLSSSSSSGGSQNDDPIVYVDYSSISDEVLRKGTANFVYFNANFNHCRHCHKFFTLWKELAMDIRWWRQVIKLFAINCSDEDNIDMCRRAGVTQFPQVKFYWVMSSSLDRDGQRVRILGKSVHAMRHLIMDKVLDSYTEHQKLLAQRAQQKSSPAAVNPLALLAGAAAAATSPAAQAGGANPLAAMLGQLMAGGGGGGAGAGAGMPAGMGSILGALTGGAAGGAKSGAAGGLGGLIGQLGGLGGVTQLLGSLMGGSSRQGLVQPLAANWPELSPLEVGSSLELLEQLPLDVSKNIGALLVLETQEFLYTGLEVMLDLGPYANQTHLARVRDEHSQLSRNLTKRDDIQAPTLIYVSPMRECRLIMTAPKYTNDEDLRRAFVRAFEKRQIKYPVRRVWAAANQAAAGQQAPAKSSESQEDEDLLEKVNQVHMSDLTNALRLSLMDQVFRHGDLSDDQYNALVKYVYALINYFPFNNQDGLKFVKRLHSWLQNQVSPMDIGEYKKQFHDIDDHIPRREWIACKSLNNTKSIPSKGKKSGNSLFENPAQFGKVVSNLTRLFRGQQQQVGKLKSLFSAFTSHMGGSAPVMLSNSHGRGSYTNTTGAPALAAVAPPPPSSVGSTGKPRPADGSGGGGAGAGATEKKPDSPIERIIKSLTSGSLGSDTSILKLISTALTGANGDSAGPSGPRSKFAREFPCGAWKLAHAMVVNEYLKDSPRKDVKHIVLHSLYQYMLHFYACSTCGNRVSDVSGEFRLNLDQRLQDQGDSVMLLWKMHNRVSKRLESETRPGAPAKVQFPPESLCQKCRAPRAANDFVSTPNWHEKQVLNFLVHHYRPQSMISGDSGSADSSATSDPFKLRGATWWLQFAFAFLTSTWMALGFYSHHVH